MEPEQTSTGSTDPRIEQTGIVLRYTILMTTASVLAGIVWGFIRITFVGSDAHHNWGAFDTDLIGRLIGVVVVAYCVYRLLLKRHPERYLRNGLAVALLTGALSGLCTKLMNPGQEFIKITGLGIAGHLLLFLVLQLLIWPKRENAEPKALPPS